MRRLRTSSADGEVRGYPALFALLQQSGVDHRQPPEEVPADQWTAIVEQAGRERLSGLLLGRLQAGKLAATIPSDVLATLKARVRGAAVRTLALRHALAEILQSCAAQHLRCVPLRGPAVADWLHPDPTLRPMDDLDVLVPREDVPAFVRLLAPLGYTQVDHRPAFAQEFYYSLELVTSRAGGILVEPHWTIAYPPFCRHLDMAPVWDRCTRRNLFGMDVWTLDHTDLVFHLCLHLAHKRTMAPLLWWAELDHAARQEALDWDRLDRQVTESGQQALVAEVLHTLHRIWRTPLPHATLVSRERRAPSVSDRVLTDSTLIGREQIATFLSLDGAGRKLRYALGLLFPSPSFMRHRYGVSGMPALWLCYPSRVVRLLWEGIKGLGVLAKLSGSWPTGRPTA